MPGLIQVFLQVLPTIDQLRAIILFALVGLIGVPIAMRVSGVTELTLKFGPLHFHIKR